MSQRTPAVPVKETAVVARQHFLHRSKAERLSEVNTAPIAVSTSSWKMINGTNTHPDYANMWMNDRNPRLNLHCVQFITIHTQLQLHRPINNDVCQGQICGVWALQHVERASQTGAKWPVCEYTSICYYSHMKKRMRRSSWGNNPPTQFQRGPLDGRSSFK